jgi:hypothetical protein
MDLDPAIFVIDLQDASKNKFFNTIFSAYHFLKLHLHNFSKIKSQKDSQISKNQGFLIEGSESGSRAVSGSGSIPLTSGSGSGRPKNMWIRKIRIRIRNTGKKEGRSNEIAVNAIYAQLHFIYTLCLKQMDGMARLRSIPIPYSYRYLPVPFICIFYPFEQRSTEAYTTALDTVPVLYMYNKYLRFFGKLW